MSPHELKIGHAYYHVTYADRDLTIPGVEPMIYVGVNIFDSEAGSSHAMYAFQDTTSYSRFGSVVNYQGPANLSEEGAVVYSFSAEEVGDLADLDGVVEAVRESQERKRALGDRGTSRHAKEKAE